MSSFLKRLSKIDDRIKYGVYGWIRKAEQELNQQHVPLMISSIIILYFHEEEIFDEITKDLIKSKNDKCVTIVRSTGDIGVANAFGIITIDSTDYGKYRWDLKMFPVREMTRGCGYDCIVGITSIEKGKYGDLNRILWNNYEATNYLYSGSVGSIYSPSRSWSSSSSSSFYGAHMRQNKISICLDLEKRQMGFIVDGYDRGNVFKHIKVGKDIKYRLVISLRNKNDSIEIVRFQKK